VAAKKKRCWQKIFHAFLYGGFQKMKAAVSFYLHEERRGNAGRYGG